MMFAVFVVLSCALILGYMGRRALSLASMFICFVLAVWLFLWEIYSPEYGFRMPWIQVEHIPTPHNTDNGKV